LKFDAPIEAPVAFKEFEALGIAHDRITTEEQSRSMIETAVFPRLLADPKPGERWLLVTSAFHMSRAIAAFRAAGFPSRPIRSIGARAAQSMRCSHSPRSPQVSL
jgi:uncharacterized SAM-binding protein YcdF (DUF218 family)